ncbi:Pentatricopeptide repeat-containing protein [Artemisia annua]|uniref:Pentatricopeptide repeat-containing protein n=1 Tax=Artemisia annua TaxID=35608 RepID=A0A2U1L346_ARTAN|nr:Pentatricopeptide repeat-containing protein [Artemisia annua]
MHKLCVESSFATVSSLFHACSCIGSLRMGNGALVDMYFKCGNITDAQSSFTSIVNPIVVAMNCFALWICTS